MEEQIKFYGFGEIFMKDPGIALDVDSLPLTLVEPLLMSPIAKI